MLALYNFLVDTVNTGFQLTHMFLSSLVNIVRMIPSFTTYTATLFAWLPQPFLMFANIGLSVSVILFVVGRI